MVLKHTLRFKALALAVSVPLAISSPAQAVQFGAEPFYTVPGSHQGSSGWWTALTRIPGIGLVVGVVGIVVTVVLDDDGHGGDVDQAWQAALDACTQSGGAPVNISVGGDEWSFDCETTGGTQ